MRYVILISLLFMACSDNQENTSGRSSNPALDFVKLPDGFKIDYFAKNLPQVRTMDISPNGIVFAGSKTSFVYALVDTNNDKVADKKYNINTGQSFANGVAFINGDLYVANINRVIKFTDIENNLVNPSYTVVYDQLPSDPWHGMKVLRQGPDQKLYLPLGAPCNTCDSTNSNLNLKYGSMNRLNSDGSGFETIATGIRNSVGYDWHPSTGELFFTDNGRDNLGNEIPPDELNRIPALSTDSHFGFPFVHGDSIMDPTFGSQGIPLNYQAPVHGFDAHSAALGMRFYTGTSFPTDYHNQIFIAHHGSWNRNPPIGYRVVVVHLNGNQVVNEEVFAEGWLNGNGGNQAFGRPVDVEIMDDGSLLVSDDHADAIYRIWYDPN